ncbi:viral ankyrin J4 [Microplitis demolitor]|uniref:NF-kappa-B inhibitor cactus n=1 Tax=Microplitis demolitor TaxID=69319 RepID=UPI00043FFDD0|nr:NF-kappa-B inhibitor cactus [Microplitis demolitor]KAG6558336.1 viral ankyrin J4 [Microplitis demolitor]
MDSSDSSNLQYLFDTNWKRHEAYTGENIFHVIAKKGWLKMLCAFEGLVDEKTKERLRKRNYHGNTCLHIATEEHRGRQAIWLIEKLVEYGADLDEKKHCDGDTVLHMAVKKGDYKLATWMCQQLSIDLEVENYRSLTAFQVALKRGDEKMMEILETHGAIIQEVTDSEEEKRDS